MECSHRCSLGTQAPPPDLSVEGDVRRGGGGGLKTVPAMCCLRHPTPCTEDGLRGVRGNVRTGRTRRSPPSTESEPQTSGSSLTQIEGRSTFSVDRDATSVLKRRTDEDSLDLRFMERQLSFRPDSSRTHGGTCRQELSLKSNCCVVVIVPPITARCSSCALRLK